jgi:hypothetical protein
MTAANKKIILFTLTLALIGGTAYALAQVKANRRLGQPGVRAEAIPGSLQLNISLPEKVLEFVSSNVPTAKVVLDYLPKDTSYAQRLYFAPDGLQVMANLILMGADRTSIHNADYCLHGQNWQILERTSLRLPIAGASPYELRVQKWKLHNRFTGADGQPQDVGGVYVFWFVAENNETDDYHTIQKSILYHLVRHGVLERWAYLSYFALCAPGQEDATFVRVKNLIANSVPEFQLPPKIEK